MIQITPQIVLDEAELTFSFARSSGPGGQNVNKVSTAVQLRFDAAGSAALPEPVKARLKVLAGRRWTKDGHIVIEARRQRTQERNRAEAVARLVDLIVAATRRPAPRRPTRPTMASKERRLTAKKKQARKKAERQTPGREG